VIDICIWLALANGTKRGGYGLVTRENPSAPLYGRVRCSGQTQPPRLLVFLILITIARPSFFLCLLLRWLPESRRPRGTSTHGSFPISVTAARSTLTSSKWVYPSRKHVRRQRITMCILIKADGPLYCPLACLPYYPSLNCFILPTPFFFFPFGISSTLLLALFAD
jgi:hypothetical protein